VFRGRFVTADRDYTRQDLIDLCERGIVHENRWHDRDSQGAQVQLGKAWALLRAGCQFNDVSEDPDLGDHGGTIWIQVVSKGFNYFFWDGEMEEDLFYIPTEERLQKAGGRDWY